MHGDRGRPFGSNRTRSFGIGEDMKVGQRQGLQKIITFPKFKLRFPAKTDHHIGPQADPIEGTSQAQQEPTVICCSVSTTHTAQNAIGTALQRNMEMRHEARTLLQCGNQIIPKEIGLHTGQAETINLNITLHAAYQGRQGVTQATVIATATSKITQIDPG